jgi:hypothetical protein
MAREAIGLPSIFIEKAAVNELVTNYQQGKHVLLSNQMGKPETKFGWYSKEQFEEIVREISYQQENHQEVSGIKMYFGAYSSDHHEYANQLTIIFVPTYFDASTSTHRDIVIDDQTDIGDRANLMSKIKNLDTIGLCPPSCGGQSSFYPY